MSKFNEERFQSRRFSGEELMEHWKKRIQETADYLSNAIKDFNLYAKDSGCHNYTCSLDDIPMKNFTDLFHEDLNNELKSRGMVASVEWNPEVGEM